MIIPGAAGLLPDELNQYYRLSPSFRGKQIFRQIAQGKQSFAEMTDLPASLRSSLAALPLRRASVAEKLEGEDSSVKLKLRLHDGAAVEAVLLSDKEGRLTACLSSQVGCPMACAFCKTGTLGFLRNLAADEIVEQFLFLADLGTKPQNIVFMGMGEPLLNLEAIRKTVSILTHSEGLNISKRKITISTCGIVPGIMDLADNGPWLRLAVSLTSADDKTRSALMPVNQKWKLAELKNALLYYQNKTGDRISLEAAIMGGENSDIASARAMAEWIKPLKAQVNIIPWNPVPELPYKKPGKQELEVFERELQRLGINIVRRARRASSVSGACGQLGDTLLHNAPDSSKTF